MLRGRKPLLIGLIIGVLIILSLLIGYKYFTSERSFRGTFIEDGIESLDFNLIDQYGLNRRFSEFKGKYVVMSFIYTHCQDICPPITLELKRFWSRVIEEGLSDDVVVILVTVDPERDTPERLREWASRMGVDDFILLTGDYGDVKEVWDWYGIYVEKSNKTTSSHEGHTGYIVYHTGLTILFDRSGYARIYYGGVPPDWRYEDILNDLKILISMGL